MDFRFINAPNVAIISLSLSDSERREKRERERGKKKTNDCVRLCMRERESASDAGVANRGNFRWTRQMGFSNGRSRSPPSPTAVRGNPRLFNGRTIASR